MTSDSNTVIVSPSGLVTARSLGIAVIYAQAGGQTGAALISVAAHVAGFSVSTYGDDTLFTGDSTFWGIYAVDSAGHDLFGRTAAWSVSDSTVVALGLASFDVWLKARKPGNAWIKATIEGLSDSAQVWVRNHVASVAIAPNGANIEIGDSIRLTAVLRDSVDTVLTDRRVTWAVLTGAAIVDSGGLVHALAAGPARVAATAEGTTGTATLEMVLDGPITALAAGDGHTCAITTTTHAYCWGNGWYGQLGTGYGDVGNKPTAVTVTNPGAFESIAAGFMHTCGIRPGGEADCWGLIGLGGLGDNTGATSCAYGELCRGIPVAVSGGLSFSALAVGGQRTCGIASGGTLYCWGANYAGQLGIGTADHASHSVPEAVIAGGLSFESVTLGGAQTCALGTSGRAYCWGANNYGELGLGGVDAVPHTTPDSVAGAITFLQLTAGGHHTCGIAADHAAYCWGVNDAGELGTGAVTAPQGQPTPVAGGRTYLQLSAGLEFTCGIATDSLAYCWGMNNFAQLGAPSAMSCGINPNPYACSAIPVPVSGALKFRKLVSGNYHTCGMATGGHVYCWGANTSRQLGAAGSAIVEYTPVLVSGQP